MRSPLRIALAAAATTALTSTAAFGLCLTAGTAAATPSSGVTAQILGQVTIADKDYILRQITIAPGGTTGWHFHDGTLYALITSGTLSHYKSDCSVDGIYNAGATLVEPSGPGHVHIGNNSATTPLVLQVVYVNPAGSPLSEDAAAPSCELPK
ncbi:cupin [Antrihabitans sp. YC3-6]|uniref:Cupin n=1 Tax=Antrihabitans stalagmiti TaxID=2799499 RepID=A0A934NWY2_9NOCA|nr:cupin [Antrihabitans stalagmiti]MBJ8342727.1 cupin [Antrihabitans stalagmiti]